MNYTVHAYAVFFPGPQPADAAAQILELRRRLWNNLAAIERAHRAKVLAIGAETPESAAWRDAHDACENLCAELKKRRSQARGRGDFSALREEIKIARERRKDAAVRAKDARKGARERQKELMATLESERIAKMKEAYHASGLWWGNYNDIIAQYNAARSAAMKTGAELKFRRREERRAQITILDTDPKSGKTTAHVMGGTHTKLQIKVTDAKRRIAEGKLRFGTDEDGEPKWLTFPLRLHRPLPLGQVRRAALVANTVLGKTKWQLQVVVEVPEALPRMDGCVVSVDIGWRRTDAGLRVGYYEADDSDHGAIVCPDSVEGALRKCDELRAVQDTMMNETRARFIEAWKACHLPAPVNDRLKELNLHLWRSGRKLAKLFRAWVPVPGDAAIQAVIRQRVHEGRDFATQYMHLARWETHGRAQAILRRREFFRVIAARILQDAKTLVIEDFNLRKMAADPLPEAAEAFTLHRQRAIAAPSELRMALLNYARREGVRVAVAPAEYTTQTCVACGLRMQYDQAAEIVHACERCGDVRDQDWTAALNLLRFREPAAGEENGCSQDAPNLAENKGDNEGAVNVPAQGLCD